jgi:nicotinate-nucleotide adenylyltransferase
VWTDSLHRGNLYSTESIAVALEMKHYITATPKPARLAILPGAFNPPTRAHVSVAESALSVVDEVLFALPRAFPHKQYTGAGLDSRIEMLRAALEGNPRFSLAVTEGGLFAEIAREAREIYGAGTELFLLCGRDAAERIVHWDYGAADSIQKQLKEFELLVASRGGPFESPPEIRHRVRSIAIPAGLEEISSSEVRRRIRSGEPWHDLVPRSVAPLIEERLDLW